MITSRTRDEPEVEWIGFAGQQGVEGIETQHEHRDGYRCRQHDGELADVRFVFDVEGGDVQPDTGRGDRREQWQVPIAPAERTVAVVVK